MTAPTTSAPIVPPVTTSQAASQASWLRYEHPFYRAHKAQWEFARDHYSGAVLDTAKIRQYLRKKAFGEHDAAYDERLAIADYTNHFAEVIESLCGMLFAVEADANRIFDDDAKRGLGDPADPASRIGQLWRRADNDGNGWLTVFKMLAIELCVTHFAWVSVDSLGSSASVRVLPALSVTNWTDDLLNVVVQEDVDERSSIEAEPMMVRQYVHMFAGGWKRYRIGSDGRAVPVTGPGGEGTWSYETPDGAPALPIFPVRLVMKRPVGWLLARKANAIFNQESARDALVRSANFPKLVLSADDTLYDKLVADLSQGSNVLQENPDKSGGGHRYAAPDTGPATVATEILKAKIDDFHKTAHREYDDAARERTATEIRQRIASGTGAFLQLLKSALDDAENNTLWRIEQQQFPDDRRRWFVARVERSDDFMPADPDAVMDRQRALAFGEKPIPLGHSGLVAIAKQLAAYQGVTVDEAEIDAAVRVRAIIEALESAPTTGLELPPEIRADLLMLILSANGLLDPEEVVKMADGTERKRMDLIREQVVAAAEAAAEAKRREAELLAGGPPPPPEPDDDVE